MTKNGIVEFFFSFGPNGYAVPTKVTDEYSGERPGDTEYPISEVTQLFRQKITEQQALKVQKKADEFKSRVNAGLENYYVLMNDTCAETARDIIVSGGIPTPEGDSPVKGGGIDKVTTKFNFVNPYAWYYNHMLSVRLKNLIYNLEGPKKSYGPYGVTNIENNLIHLKKIGF